jgi:hypothetical protein
MPENIKELSPLEAASLLSRSSTATTRLDSDGQRISDAVDEDEEDLSAQADEVGTEETPSTDDDDASDGDEDEEATDSDEFAHSTIEPPQSFTSEEKAEFAKLPSRMQETVLRREADRDRAISQRMNQIAEERKQIEPHIRQLQQEQTKYTQTINQLMSLTIPELNEFQNVDWVFTLS